MTERMAEKISKEIYKGVFGSISEELLKKFANKNEDSVEINCRTNF